MNPTLKQSALRANKQAIRAFIRAHWNDQKLTEVYAFNRDGKMSALDGCSCIRGVTFSDTLHQLDFTRPIASTHDPFHYSKTTALSGATQAEYAYIHLAGVLSSRDPSSIPALRQRRLSAILRAEMRRRDRMAGPRSGLNAEPAE